MSIDLMGLVTDHLKGAAMGKISEFLGESSEGTTSALGAALPTLLGGVMEKASTNEGAGSIMNLLKDGNHDGGILSNIGGLLGSGDGISSLLGGGSGILSAILGPKVGGIVDLVASVSGIKKSSSSSLLSLAAPLLMGVIGKQVSSQGLGISGLASMLMGQKDAVKAALPAGAGSLLNLGSLGDFVGDAKAAVGGLGDAAKGAASSVVNEVEEASTGGFNFWPWLIGAAAIAAAAYFYKGCSKPTVDTSAATEMVDSLSATAGAIGDSASALADSASATVAAFTKKLSSGFELKGSGTGIESQLISFIEDGSKAVDKTTWFNFDNMLFDTGKSTIKAESQVQVQNIAEILKAFPKVNLKVGGYTDNVGSEASNQKLSAARAEAVKAAVVALGIDAKRLEAEGYGSQHPVASNDTEEGRAQNRRIAARVTSK
jgi:OmpA-OmpF porin, OOP family